MLLATCSAKGAGDALTLGGCSFWLLSQIQRYVDPCMLTSVHQDDWAKKLEINLCQPPHVVDTILPYTILDLKSISWSLSVTR